MVPSETIETCKVIQANVLTAKNVLKFVQQSDHTIHVGSYFSSILRSHFHPVLYVTCFLFRI